MQGDEGSARLVARERVRLALLVALLGATVAGVLGWFVDGSTSDTRVDRLAERAVLTVLPMEDGVLGLLGQAVADLGSPPVVAVLMVVVAALAYVRRGPRALALVLVGPPTAMVTTSTILKPIIGRTRGMSLAYPSGHTTAATSIAVVVAILVLSSALLPARRRAVVLALGATVLGVAVSQVGRDYHYATDTIGAVGLALAVVLVAAVTIDAMADSMAVAPGEVIGSRASRDGPTTPGLDPSGEPVRSPDPPPRSVS